MEKYWAALCMQIDLNDLKLSIISVITGLPLYEDGSSDYFWSVMQFYYVHWKQIITISKASSHISVCKYNGIELSLGVYWFYYPSQTPSSIKYLVILNSSMGNKKCWVQ